MDSSGDAYVTGDTDATDFPTTPGAFKTTSSGNGFSAVTSSRGRHCTALTYLGDNSNTYLGGPHGHLRPWHRRGQRRQRLRHRRNKSITDFPTRCAGRPSPATVRRDQAQHGRHRATHRSHLPRRHRLQHLRHWLRHRRGQQQRRLRHRIHTSPTTDFPDPPVRFQTTFSGNASAFVTNQRGRHRTTLATYLGSCDFVASPSPWTAAAKRPTCGGIRNRLPHDPSALPDDLTSVFGGPS